MSFVSSFLGLNHLSKESRSLVKKYVMLNTLSTIAVSLSSTFFYLFTIDALGFLNASVIFALRVFVQFVVDYPSGSLGDWIGQKRVLVLSYISYFFTFSLLFIAQTYLHFILIAIFMGIALAQESGALGSWLDNNYKKIEDQSLDPDRRNYGFTQSRLYTLLVFTLGIVVPVGGFLSELITRRLVFLLQSILTLGMILIFYFSVNDIKTDKGVKERQDKETPQNGYFAFLKGGIKFAFSSKPAFFFIFGFSIFMAAWSLWVLLLTLPIYFGYTGSDALTSLIRSLSFLIGGAIEIVTANISKQISTKHYPRLMLLHSFYYLPLIAIVLLLPPPNTFNPIIFVLLVALAIIFNRTIWPIALTLHQRIMLDLVPSEMRNGVYSLVPTLQSLMTVPLLLIGGSIVELYGLGIGITISFLGGFIAAVFLFLSLHFMQKQTTTDLSVQLEASVIS